MKASHLVPVLIGLLVGWLVMALMLGERGAGGAGSSLEPPGAQQTLAREHGAMALETQGSPEERAPAAIPQEAPEGTQAGAPGSQAASSVLVYGAVTNLDGEPMPKAYLSSVGVNGEYTVVQTDAEGRHSFGPLDPRAESPKTLTAASRDFFAVEKRFDLPLGQDTLRVDFVLRPKRVIWVRVQHPEPAAPAGEEVGTFGGFSWLVPVATREDPGDTFYGVSGSPNNPFGIGSFWMNHQADRDREGADWLGTVTLNEEGPAWISLIAQGQVLAKEELGEETTEVTFVLDPASMETLSGELRAELVADEDGRPLAGKAWLNDDPFMFGKPLAVEADGLLWIPKARLGRSWLVVRAEGRAVFKRHIELKRGQLLELGELRLKVPVEIKGRVVDGEGKPLVAVLRWGRVDPESSRFKWVRQESAQSVADGSFTLGGLEPDLWSVQVQGLPASSPRPYEPSLASEVVVVDARGGSVTGLEFRLQKTIPITVVLAAEKPMPRLRVLDDAGGLVVYQNLGWSGDRTVLHLLPGHFVFELERDGAPTERRDVDVGSEPLDVEL